LQFRISFFSVPCQFFSSSSASHPDRQTSRVLSHREGEKDRKEVVGETEDAFLRYGNREWYDCGLNGSSFLEAAKGLLRMIEPGAPPRERREEDVARPQEGG
jgi:hypothetical protein